MHKFSSLLAVTLIIAWALPGHAETVTIGSSVATQTPGIGSGLNVQGIVSGLVQAEITPMVERKTPPNVDVQQPAQPSALPISTKSPPTRIKIAPFEDMASRLLSLGF